MAKLSIRDATITYAMDRIANIPSHQSLTNEKEGGRDTVKILKAADAGAEIGLSSSISNGGLLIIATCIIPPRTKTDFVSLKRTE